MSFSNHYSSTYRRKKAPEFMSSAERAPRRNDEWETGAPLTAPRTLVECEP